MKRFLFVYNTATQKGSVKMKKGLLKQKRVVYAVRKNRVLMKKSKKRWVTYGLIFGGMAVGILFNGQQVQAAEWVANTPEAIVERIKDQSVTMIEGDTVWNIGLAINIKDPMQLLFDNGFKNGEQYTLPVGTVISWDGDHVIVKDSQGKVIGDKIVQDEEKIETDKPIASQAVNTSKTTEAAKKSQHSELNAELNKRVSDAKKKLVKTAEKHSSSTKKPEYQKTDSPESESQRLEAQLAIEKAKLEELLAALAEKYDLEDQAFSDDESIEYLRDQEAEIQEMIAIIQEEMAASKAALAESQTAYDQALADVNTSQAALVAAQQQVEQHTNEKKQADANAAALEQTLAEAKQTGNQDAIADAESQLQAARTLQEQLAAQLTDAQNALAASETEAADKAAALQAAEAALNEDKDLFSRYLTTEKTTRKLLEGTQADLAASKGLTDNQWDALEQEIDDLEAAVEKQEAIVADLTEKLGRTKAAEAEARPEELEWLKAASLELINLFTYTDEQTKNELSAQVKAAKTEAALDEIMEAAVYAEDEAYDSDDLSELREEALSLFDTVYTELTDAEINTYYDAVKKAATGDEIVELMEGIVEDANLRLVQNRLISDLTSGSYNDQLTTAQINEYLARAKAAKTIDDITALDYELYEATGGN